MFENTDSLAEGVNRPVSVGCRILLSTCDVSVTCKVCIFSMLAILCAVAPLDAQGH